MPKSWSLSSNWTTGGTIVAMATMAGGGAFGQGSGVASPTQSPPIVKAVGNTMTETYSRIELDAKLETQAAKAETARIGLEGKMDLVLAGLDTIKTDLRDFKTEAKADAAALRGEVKEDYRNVKNTLIGVAIGALGIVIAIIGLAYTQAGNMTTANGNVLAAFSAGQAAAAAQQAPVVSGAPK